jgi:tetratricopeptide (TPR) repeat protein
LHWAKVHQPKMIAIGAAVVILAAALVWNIHSRIESRQEAQTQFNECQMSADRALMMKDTGEARAEAIKDAVSHFDSLVKSYPDSDVAPQALLKAAQLLYSTGQPAKAASYCERLLEMSGAPEGMKLLARRYQAEALEQSGQSGDLEKALAQYKTLAALAEAQRAKNESVTPEAVEAYWDIGRCCEMLKDPENAKSYYKKAIDADSESKWAGLARFRVEALNRGPASAGAALVFPLSKSQSGAPANPGAATAATGSAQGAATSAPESATSTPASTVSAPATSSAAPATTAPAAE